MTRGFWAHVETIRKVLCSGVITLSILSCGIPDHSQNVKPGDADYPVVKEHPESVLKIRLIAPSSLHPHILIGYSAHESGGDFKSGTACAYRVGLGDGAQYGLPQIVELSKTSEGFSGTVTIDRYVRGRCDWEFAGAWYFANDDQSHRMELFFYDSEKKDVPQQRVDIWCVRIPGRSAENATVCMTISNLHDQFPVLVTLDDVNVIASMGGASRLPLHFGKAPGTLIVQFHDMDAAGGDRLLRSVE